MFPNPDATGLSVFLRHVLDLALVVGLLAVSEGLGTTLLRRFKVKAPDSVSSLAFGTVLGAAALANAVLLLGAVGWLSPLSLALLLLFAGVLGRKGLLSLPSRVGALPRFLKREGGWGVALAWGLVVTGGVGLFLLLLGAAPPVDWDTLMYHLPVPSQFLEKGRIFLPPDNLHTSFVGLLHMLYLPLLAAGSVAGPALLNGALAVLLALTLFSMGARFFNGETASLTMGAVWGTTTLLLVAITPRTDVSLALFLLLAHYAFLLALEEEGEVGWAYLGAFLVGLSAGVKFNGMAYGAGLAPLALWVAWRSGAEKGTGDGNRPEPGVVVEDSPKKGDAAPGGPAAGEGDGPGPGGVAEQARCATGAALLMVALGMVAVAPWLVKNWALLGAPFYPYFAHRLIEPWLQALYEAAPAVQAPDPALSQALRGIRAPVSLWGVFFAPGGMTAEGEGAFYFTNRILLLLPLGIFFLRRRNLAWLVTPPLLYLILILVPFPSTNLRYLIPAVPALTLAVSFVLLEAGGRLLPRRFATVGVLVVATLALGPSWQTSRQWLTKTEAVPHFVGRASSSDYWATHLDPGVRTFAPMVRFVNDHVPDTARVLLLFEARGFPLEPRVIQDNKITNWPYLVGVLPEGECGEEVGADYLLLASAALNYYQQRGLDPGKLRWERFERFAEACLGPIFHVPGYVLFRWKHDVPGAAGVGTPGQSPTTASPPSVEASPPDPPAAFGSRR